MLLLAVLFLLSAGGLLIATFVTGHVALAWGSVGVSAVAGIVILVRQRRSRRPVRGEPEVGSPPQGEPADAESSDGSSAGSRDAGSDDPEQFEDDPTKQNDPTKEDDPQEDDPAQEEDPAEEDTDAADLPFVLELADEVLVVDEYPRYHLVGCSWADSAHIELLPVREARELGFTPCAQCSPDTALVRRHRAESAT